MYKGLTRRETEKLFNRVLKEIKNEHKYDEDTLPGIFERYAKDGMDQIDEGIDIEEKELTPRYIVNAHGNVVVFEEEEEPIKPFKSSSITEVKEEPLDDILNKVIDTNLSKYVSLEVKLSDE